MCHTVPGGNFSMKFHTNFSQKYAQNRTILIWNRSVMCHISQGGIIWMKFYTQFQLTISKNTWNYDFELKSYTSYVSRRYHLNEISYSISTNNKQKFMKLWFWIEVLCVIFLKEVSSEWDFILISAKNQHKVEEIWFGIEVLCVLFLKRVFF